MYKGDYCKLCGTHKMLTGNWMEVCSDCVRELILDREGYIAKLHAGNVYGDKGNTKSETWRPKVPETNSGSSFSK